MSGAVDLFAAAAVRSATPLALAALGEMVAERAGVINLGLEGVIIAGALGAAVGASSGVAAGFTVAALAGAAVAGVFALFAVRIRTDQIITGTAVTLLALGLTATLYVALYGAAGVALTLPTQAVLTIPVLARIPVLGPAFFAQPPITYFLYVAVPVVWWWLYRTHAGLMLRATGEHPEAALVAGGSPVRVQGWAVLFGGVMGGLSGGSLVLAQVGTFAEGMSAGRGYIAIAIVAFGRWHPIGVAVAALVFGAASALQYLFQAMGWNAPYQIFLALPYALTLAALAIAAARGRTAAPAALGRRQLLAEGEV